MTALVPRFPLNKEWDYAVFFFLLPGAIFTHLAVGDKAVEYFGSSLLLVLTIVSWFFSPANRKITSS
ncbi:hypothetical protein U3A58_10895 [Algoriphagus sp. C2-6-M1]|uniref:hypothetical protein n=1 Tax=Algoriphagus persicinus TaxID=3108754 RepID=UPI002B3ABBE7|nr:hypothetical protein [Algoriphagus sp. C2-6-M1]MEB2780900.1 hypothetical protein [Algoriphagus sp. C2-6-M1]